MRVLLISANTERLNMPTIPLGLGFVAAAAKRAGHDVEFLDLMFNRNPQAALHNRIGVFNPEVIGISVRNIDDQNLESPRFLLENVRPLIEWCRTASSAPIILPLQVVVSGAHRDSWSGIPMLCCWCAPDTTLGLRGS